MKPSHEYDLKYDSKRRFASYWHQIHEVLDCNPKQILEIGIGNGFVSNYLRGRSVTVTTVDIEEELRPDVVADVAKLPFPDNTFDVVTCYEVLEHIPYEKALKGLRELWRVSSEWILISLPDATHAFRFAITIPRAGYIQKVVSVPFFFPRKYPYAKSHEWEIGVAGYARSKVVNDITRSGFLLVRSYRIYENPYHHFFVFRKRSI